jgi:hypothetical protein
MRRINAGTISIRALNVLHEIDRCMTGKGAFW